jgi:hypothetical protein
MLDIGINNNRRERKLFLAYIFVRFDVHCWYYYYYYVRQYKRKGAFYYFCLLSTALTHRQQVVGNKFLSTTPQSSLSSMFGPFSDQQCNNRMKIAARGMERPSFSLDYFTKKERKERRNSLRQMAFIHVDKFLVNFEDNNCIIRTPFSAHYFLIKFNYWQIYSRRKTRKVFSFYGRKIVIGHILIGSLWMKGKSLRRLANSFIS